MVSKPLLETSKLFNLGNVGTISWRTGGQHPRRSSRKTRERAQKVSETPERARRGAGLRPPGRDFPSRQEERNFSPAIFSQASFLLRPRSSSCLPGARRGRQRSPLRPNLLPFCRAGGSTGGCDPYFFLGGGASCWVKSTASRRALGPDAEESTQKAFF